MRSDSDYYRLIHIRDNLVKAALFIDDKSFYAVTRAL